MYTLETLIPDCVGRYITNASGNVQLASLINGRAYAKCWQALVYWIVSQYELGHSTNIAPLGVIVRANNTIRSSSHSKYAQDSSADSDAGAHKPANFCFLKTFTDKYNLKLKKGEAIREDDMSTIRMNLATLARLAGVEPGTFRIAISHLFRRLGEILSSKEQVLIDFSIGSLIGDKGQIEFLFHEQQEAKQLNEKVQSDPRLLSKSGRWKKPNAAIGVAPSNSGGTIADNRTLRSKYPLDRSIHEESKSLDPSDVSFSLGDSAVIHHTSQYNLGRLIEPSAILTEPIKNDTLPHSKGGFRRKLKGQSPLKNVRKGLIPSRQPAPPIAYTNPILSQTLIQHRSKYSIDDSATPSESATPAHSASPRNTKKLVPPVRLDAISASFSLSQSQDSLRQSSPSTASRPSSSQLYNHDNGIVSVDMDQTALIASDHLTSLSGQKRKLLTGAVQNNLPPVLDGFARTQASTYSDESFYHSASAKVACFYTPEACAWHIDTESGKFIYSGFSPFIADRLEQNDEQKKIARRRLERRTTAEITLEDRATAKSLMRYEYYIEYGIEDSVLAPIKEEWIRNGLALLSTNISSITEERVEELVREMLLELKIDYNVSMKRAILDYVLRNVNERQRLSVHIPPAPCCADWGLGESIPRAARWMAITNTKILSCIKQKSVS